MKLKKFANLLLLVLMVAVVTGCPKRPEDRRTIYGHEPENINNATNVGPADAFGNGTNVTESEYPQPKTIRDDWPQNREIFKDDTVHFAFDSSAVRNDEKPKAARVASYLKSHPEDALRVEGHCDERGTAEYNRALGERRALALRETLIKDGVDSERVETITYGFDRPADPAHTDAAWAKNRRGEFILLTPPAKAAVSTNSTDTPK